MIYFFFSSRRRHTRCSRDWSSDVCSSDLKRTAPRSPSPRVCPRAKSSRWRAQCGVTSVRGPDNYDADQLPCGGLPEIGRASGRERGEISVVAGSLKKKEIEVTEGAFARLM